MLFVFTFHNDGIQSRMCIAENERDSINLTETKTQTSIIDTLMILSIRKVNLPATLIYVEIKRGLRITSQCP